MQSNGFQGDLSRSSSLLGSLGLGLEIEIVKQNVRKCLNLEPSGSQHQPQS